MAQCTAHRRNSGGVRCRQHAISGSNVCRWHGGANPSVVRAGKRRLAQQRAAELLEDLGTDVEPIEDPVSELQRVAGRMKALQDLLWAELHPRDGTRPDPAAVEVFQDSADRLAKQLAELQRLGLFRAQVQVEATKAQLLAQALQAILRDLNLSPHQRALAPGLIREHLLALPDAPVSVNGDA